VLSKGENKGNWKGIPSSLYLGLFRPFHGERIAGVGANLGCWGEKGPFLTVLGK